MSERTVPQVECELCGEPFDPTAAGGWCTNDDCGEWQYETYADYDPEDAGDEGDGSLRSDAPAEPEAADAASPDVTAEVAAGEATGSPGDAVETPDEVPDTPVEKNADGPGVDLESCPECGAEADPSHRFCTGCGTDLDEIRADLAAVTTCPECEADVDEADRYCPSCGADFRAAIGDDADDTGESSIDDLSLEAHGRSIVVEPGETVGREVRSLLADAGRPDDEAVRVHREHVRFVREDESFFVVDLGENPTAVNGDTLQKGDRVPVEPGDELTLSEVVTLTVGTKNA